MIQPSERTIEFEGGEPSPAVKQLILDHGGTYTDPVWGNQAVFETAWHKAQFVKALQHLQEEDGR